MKSKLDVATLMCYPRAKMYTIQWSTLEKQLCCDELL